MGLKAWWQEAGWFCMSLLAGVSAVLAPVVFFGWLAKLAGVW